MMKNTIRTTFLLLLFAWGVSGCVNDEPWQEEIEEDQAEKSLTVPIGSLTSEQLTIQAYVKDRPIIAHRGTTDYAPQDTEASFRYARYVGADYIQVDLQMSKDGVLVGVKGDNLKGTSDVAKVFPGLEEALVNFFTLNELKRLDVGSWFESSTYDRPGFKGLQILTLEEIINICEGKMPDGSPDPADQGNRPGIYIRTYEPWLNPGMEEALKAELTRLGWYAEDFNNLKEIPTTPGKVDVANTKGRVMLATMEQSSLFKLYEVFQGKIPMAFWIWKSSNFMTDDDAVTYANYVSMGIAHGAQFIAPNTSTNDLLLPWQSNMIRRSKARIHGFTIDTKANMAQYTYNNLSVGDGNIYQLEYDLTDGFITDRPQYALFFYGRYYLADPLVPAPPYYDSNAIKAVFDTLGY